MRYRLLASYQGAPYEAGLGPDEAGVVLFAACPPPEDLHFEPATGHWRKEVSRADVQMLYQSRPVGTFRGESCVVLDDLTERLHIAYLGHDAYRAEQLGYWEVDRGVFELITPRHEVTDIVEQRLPLSPHDTGSQPRPATDPLGQAVGRGPQADGTRPDEIPERLLPGAAGFQPAAQPAGHGPQTQNGLLSFPRDQMPAGPAAQEADQAGPPGQSRVSVPIAGEPPLPLEAEAMRAATAATRRVKKSPKHVATGSASEPPAATPPAASVPAIPSTPAGISEPSGAAHHGADAASAVPSWTPQAHVPPQRQAQSETARQADGPSLPTAQPQAQMSPRADTPPLSGAPTQTQPAPNAESAARAAQPAPNAEPAARAQTEPRADAPPRSAATPQAEPELRADTPPHPAAPPQAQTELRADTPPLPSSSPPQADTTPPAHLPADAQPPQQARAPVPPIDDALIHGVPLPLGADAARRQPRLPSQAQPPAGGPVAADQPAAAGTAHDLRPRQPDPAAPEQKGATQGGNRETQAAAAGGSSEPALAAAYPPDQPALPIAAALGGAPAVLAGSSPDAASVRPGPDGQREPAPLIAHQPHADGQAPPRHPAQDHHLVKAQPAAQPEAPVAAPEALAAAQPEALAAAQPGALAVAQPDTLAAAQHAVAIGQPDTLAAAQHAVAIGQPGIQPAVQTQIRPDDLPVPATEAQPALRQRRASRRRLPTHRIFSELASQAGIPADAYAIGEDVDGAMCLVQTSEGFEVFNAAAGARHEVRVFHDEESAYFYLFGVLVAEAVRTGVLAPR